MTVGLVLGKFAPLHKGHQLVIETALAETDRVIVLIYDAPETTPVPLTVRAAWIRELYPEVEVLESWDGPVEVGDEPEITSRHDAYLQKKLAGRGVTHFFSSELYGEHVSQALGAVDRRVDPERTAVPVSGSLLREALFDHRQYLHPRVYWDLVVKVALLGAPSTGKTTLAEALAERFESVWVPEYGREYWQRHQVDRRLSPEQLVEIARGHRQLEEEAVLDANGYLFVDTEAITTLQFAHDYHGSAPPELERLAAEARTRYDLFFLCAADIPYDDSPDRSGAVHRELFQRRLRSELARLKVPHTLLTGPLRARIARVEEALAGFSLY